MTVSQHFISSFNDGCIVRIKFNRIIERLSGIHMHNVDLISSLYVDSGSDLLRSQLVNFFSLTSTYGAVENRPTLSFCCAASYSRKCLANNASSLSSARR